MKPTQTTTTDRLRCPTGAEPTVYRIGCSNIQGFYGLLAHILPIPAWSVLHAPQQLRAWLAEQEVAPTISMNLDGAPSLIEAPWSGRFIRFAATPGHARALEIDFGATGSEMLAGAVLAAIQSHDLPGNVEVAGWLPSCDVGDEARWELMLPATLSLLPFPLWSNRPFDDYWQVPMH